MKIAKTDTSYKNLRKARKEIELAIDTVVEHKETSATEFNHKEKHNWNRVEKLLRKLHEEVKWEMRDMEAATLLSEFRELEKRRKP